MQAALQLAQHAVTQEEVPVGAVVIRDGNIIGKGWNQPIVRNDPCAHAEIMALRAAANSLHNYRLPNTTLYVTLEPCMMCVGAIVHARVKRVVFGAYDPKTGAAGSAFDLLADKRHNHTIEITGGILEQDCAAILQEFFRMRR
jgi:tRNA(adenine34) deaminase